MNSKEFYLGLEGSLRTLPRFFEKMRTDRYVPSKRGLKRFVDRLNQLSGKQSLRLMLIFDKAPMGYKGRLAFELQKIPGMRTLRCKALQAVKWR